MVFNLINRIFFPKICIVCKKLLYDWGGDLCTFCWNSIDFLPQKIWSINVVKDFSHSIKIYGYCATNYKGSIKTLIKRFKHADQLHLRNFLLTLLIRFFPQKEDFFPDYLVPIPIHWRRLLRRNYNQSSILCYMLADRYNIPVFNGLKRIRFSPMQKSKDAIKRLENVFHTMEVKDPKKEIIKRKKILIIDDVITSGSTIATAVRALKKNDIEEVRFLVLSSSNKSFK